MKMQFSFALSILLGLPNFALAQLGEVICDDSARIEAQIARMSGAVRQGGGLRSPDTMLEVWIAPSSGDWTLVQSYANGTSCIVAMGEHWETFTPDADPA